MPLYRWNADNLEPVQPTMFEAEQLQERNDLQRLLRDQPEVLEEGLFIVAEEFSNWEDSSRRIDLLALDSVGRLTVIELKRTESGDLMDLQAIRYAAMVSNIAFDQVVDAHSSYMLAKGIEGQAGERIQEHLANSENGEMSIESQRPRIILASAGFSKEMTTTVLWLRDSGIDIGCVKLPLYRNGNGLLLDSSQIIPLPEASEYLVRVRERTEEARRHKTGVSRVTSGGMNFFESIETAGEEARPALRMVHQWATGMESEGLVSLSTVKGSNSTNLRIGLPHVDVSLVVVRNWPPKQTLRLRPRHFESYAPNSKSRIENIIGRPFRESTTPIFLSSLKDGSRVGLLDALTDAYREANGLPPTTSRPDTLPDSPLPAE